jgi:uncharacterized protein (DUF1330 family)
LNLLAALLLSFAAFTAGTPSQPPQAAPAPADAAPRSALMLIEADIHDMDGFRAYTQAIIPIVQRFGGTYVVMRGQRQDLEGDWGTTRVVISRWPSMEAARAFWFSPEYQDAIKLRQGTGSFRVTLLETAP